jgi:hypothetical protein
MDGWWGKERLILRDIAGSNCTLIRGIAAFLICDKRCPLLRKKSSYQLRIAEGGKKKVFGLRVTGLAHCRLIFVEG